MVRLLAVCTAAFELFLVAHALIESTPRTHLPQLEKRIAGLLAVRSVSCGNGESCADGQKCVPNGCCLLSDVVCSPADGGGCCRSGTYCDDFDGCCPNGETCTAGGGGIITLPNPGDDTPTTTNNFPAPTLTHSTPTSSPATQLGVSTSPGFGGGGFGTTSFNIPSAVSSPVTIAAPSNLGGTLGGLNPTTTANSGSGAGAGIAANGGVAISISVWKVAAFALLSTFFL
ncbi:hypothetical protein BU17DRAFT_91213 [Hysterangium stoloniferum]|nr:hypothetical protein BU17DRAFT_91213 [Hysterangium stoloniferum]